MKVIVKFIFLGLGAGLVVGLALSAFIYLSTRWRIRSQHIDPGTAATILCSADMASGYAPVFMSLLGVVTGGLLGVCIVSYRFLFRNRIA